MSRPVQWSREALDDVKEQVDYIASDNPAATRQVADRIRDTAATLGEMATGRPGRVTGVYEKSVSRLPYVIAYAVISSGGRVTISILRIIHTSRDWPAEDWPE